MNVITLLLLFLPVAITGLVVLKITPSHKILHLFLAFSGAFLISISAAKIIPEVFSSNASHLAAYFLLGGFFLQLFLDYLTKGVEHGHHDCHEHNSVAHIHPIPMFIGVCLHSFFEGMPFNESFHDHHLQHSLLLGIGVHNIPLSIVLMSLFLKMGYSPIKSLSLILVFALSAPLGNVASVIIGNTFFSNIEAYFTLLMGMVAGIFLHISTTILFESGENHRIGIQRLLVIFLGVGLALL